MTSPATSLDQLKLGMRARITSIDWAVLADSEASRLRHFGFDEGVAVQPLHLGPVSYTHLTLPTILLV